MDPEDVAFCFPVGGEKYIEECVYLAKSISNFHPESKVFAGIKKGRRSELDEELVSELEEFVEIVEFEVLLEGYPEINKTATMEYASEKTEKSVLVSLDTDLLVSGNFVEVLSDSVSGLDSGWMMVKNANYGSGRHLLDKGSEEWEELYNRFDAEFPGFIYRSSYDDSKIPPYFAGGVVATDSMDFCRRWNELTAEVYDVLGTRYSDQVALGILSRSYKLGVFEEKYFWDTPSNMESTGEEVLIHYSKLRQLTIVSSERLEEVKRVVGLDLRDKFSGFSYPVSVFKAYLLYFYLKFNLPRYFEESKLDIF